MNLSDDRAEHFHDQAGNIWLAVIVVFATIIGVKWPMA